MFKKIYLGILFLLFLGFIYLAFITFKPIRKVSIEDVLAVNGIVTTVSEQKGDMYITIENDPHTYYIKSYKRHQLDFFIVEQAIFEKEITLYHINKWTPLTKDGVYPHISRIVVGNTQIFNEIEQ